MVRLLRLLLSRSNKLCLYKICWGSLPPAILLAASSQNSSKNVRKVENKKNKKNIVYMYSIYTPFFFFLFRLLLCFFGCVLVSDKQTRFVLFKQNRSPARKIETERKRKTKKIYCVYVYYINTFFSFFAFCFFWLSLARNG